MFSDFSFIAAAQWLQKRKGPTWQPFEIHSIALWYHPLPLPPYWYFQIFTLRGLQACNGYKRVKGRPGDRRNCVSRLLPAADDDGDDDDDDDHHHHDADDDDDHHAYVDNYDDHMVGNDHHHKINDGGAS